MGATKEAVETIELDPESRKVLLWRKQWLVASGYSMRNADLLASSGVGLWFACDAMKHAKEHGYDEDYVIKLLL